MIPSVTCLRLSDASVICRVTYFPFPIQSVFLSCRKLGSCSGVRGLSIIGLRTLPKMWEVCSLYTAYIPGERRWIDSKGIQVETRHPLKGYFGSEFRAICNHCGVMAAWSRKSWKLCEQFYFAFLEKRPLRYNFQYSVPKVCIASLIDVVVFKFRKMLPTRNR